MARNVNVWSFMGEDFFNKGAKLPERFKIHEKKPLRH
jgi:hypothetical protein